MPACVSTGVKHPGAGTVLDMRALECAVAAGAALLAADVIRATLAPIWQALRLAFGI
jgi:hypothetical protein